MASNSYSKNLDKIRIRLLSRKILPFGRIRNLESVLEEVNNENFPLTSEYLRILIVKPNFGI